MFKPIRILVLANLRRLSPRVRAGMLQSAQRIARNRLLMEFGRLMMACLLLGVPFGGLYLITDETHGPSTKHVLWLVAASVATAVIVGIVHNAWCWMRLKHLVRDTWSNGRPPICYACNYDLRGSPGPTCPECGEKIPTLADLGMAEDKEPRTK